MRPLRPLDKSLEGTNPLHTNNVCQFVTCPTGKCEFPDPDDGKTPRPNPRFDLVGDLVDVLTGKEVKVEFDGKQIKVNGVAKTLEISDTCKCIKAIQNAKLQLKDKVEGEGVTNQLAVVGRLCDAIAKSFPKCEVGPGH
jgi:hypothetical protein